MGKIGHGIRLEADSLFTLCSRSPLYNETWNMFFHNSSFPEINCNQIYNIMPFPRVGGSVGTPWRAFGVRERSENDICHQGGHLVYGTGLGVRSCGEIAIFVTTDALWEIAASWKTTAT